MPWQNCHRIFWAANNLRPLSSVTSLKSLGDHHPPRAIDIMKAKRTSFPKRLVKKAKRGFRGYPVATIAFYGPDDRFASKAAVGIIAGEGEEALALERWFCEDLDVRNDPEIGEEILRYITLHDVKSVVTTGDIIGCPHEQGVDYEGTTCPKCPYWANRDRWTGETSH
jgi:hypothetical protein